MIIDCHVHLASPEGRYDPQEVADCKRMAERAGIGRAVYLFNLKDRGGYDPAPEDVRRSNDLGMWLVREHADFFLGFCYLSPAHDPAFSLAEIERCVVAGPLTGIKLWVSVHADDARLDPIMERAAELGVPVLHHAWYKATGFAFNESTPAQIATLARRHPTVTICRRRRSIANSSRETCQMIGATKLRLMPDNALLVNTARSWVIDIDALLAELQSGRIRAALDVFDEEPLPADSPFRRARWGDPSTRVAVSIVSPFVPTARHGRSYHIMSWRGTV